MENYSCEQLYDIIEDEILCLKICPGEVLSENILCERFGISRTPARTILQRLQDNGLVEIKPYKGCLVRLLNFDVINQIIYQRLAVECMVLGEFMDICTPVDIERVRHAYLELAACLQAGELDENRFYDADSRMHEIWFKTMRKMYLFQQFRADKSDYKRFAMLDVGCEDSMREIVAEHAQILAMIEQGRRAEIIPVMKLHLYGGIRRVGNDVFTKYAAFFSDIESAE
ncbi:MAG: GntR family transcriptional regulator [Faecalibacterium sp.]